MPTARALAPERPAVEVERDVLLGWYRRLRERSRQIFDLVQPEARLCRPIPLRHPIVFYEGHLPVFTVNTLLKKALGRPGFDAHFETLFARGIDPESEEAAAGKAINIWPSREAIEDYAAAADRAVADAIANAEIEREGDPLREDAQAVYACFEHEAMHQETLLYILHRLPFEQKRRPGPWQAVDGGEPPAPGLVSIPAGRATLGAERRSIRFGWDNEYDAHTVDVPAFAIDTYKVTNADYLHFVEQGGYRNPTWWTPESWAWRSENDVQHPLFWERHDDRWVWRGMFDLVDLPPSWPVYVSHAEATAYANWMGRRLPTETEFHRAAYGAPSGEERAYPWGDATPDPARHGHFDFAGWDPVAVGSFPQGASAWGVHDLVGNGWEWTNTIFAPFAGFEALPSYPEYSADFFDGQHFVMKGASSGTSRELVRRSFRNWFRAQYPYVYAGFRLVA